MNWSLVVSFYMPSLYTYMKIHRQVYINRKKNAIIKAIHEKVIPQSSYLLKMNQYFTIYWKKVRVTAILKIRAFNDFLIVHMVLKDNLSYYAINKIEIAEML